MAIYYTKGSFTLEQFNDYIKNNLSTKEYKFLNNIWQNDEDTLIDFISITMPNEKGYMYNELLLLDIRFQECSYLPVYIENINTSSPYAFMRSEFDEEIETMELYDLKELIMKNYNIDKIVDIVLSKNISK